MKIYRLLLLMLLCVLSEHGFAQTHIFCAQDLPCTRTSTADAPIGIAHSTPQMWTGGGANPGITFKLTDNPGIPGNGFYIYGQQFNSTGVLVNPCLMGIGLTVTTNANESGVWDWNCLAGGVRQGVSLGGDTANTGTLLFTPDAFGKTSLGQAGQGWNKLRLEGNSSTINGGHLEFRDNNSAATNVYRIYPSGTSVLFNHNTAALGDFSTSVTDLTWLGAAGFQSNNGFKFSSIQDAPIGIAHSTPTIFQGSGANPGITFDLTDNPGLTGAATYLYWTAFNSAGTKMNTCFVGPGFATTTAGAEEADWDMNCIVGGTRKGMTIGGVAGQGTKWFATPDQSGQNVLGLLGQSWWEGIFEGNDSTIGGGHIIFKNTNATLPNGMFRVMASGNSLIFDRNTAAGGDFSTHVIDMTEASNGDIQIAGGFSVGGGTRVAAIGVASVSCGTTAAAVGATATCAIAWGVTLPNSAYKATCTLTGVTNVPTVVGTSAKAATTMTVTIAALTAAAATGTVECNAFD